MDASQIETTSQIETDGIEQSDRDALMRYLTIFNRAVTDAGGRFPFRVVLDALRTQLAGRPVAVEIAGTSPQTHQVEWRFEQGRLVASVGLNRPVAARWMVEREHVDDVLARPWRYLADPMRLELPPFALCAKRMTMCSIPIREAPEAADSA